MRNVFSFTLAGALGLSAAVGATSFATVDFEDTSFPQVLSELGFDFTFDNAVVEQQAPVLPMLDAAAPNNVVSLRPVSTITPFGVSFEAIANGFPVFDTAFTISRGEGGTFGFDSALVDASSLGSGQVLAFATRNDGSFVGQLLTPFNTGGRVFSSFNPSAPAFGSGLTSLSFAATGEGTSVSFDNIILCDPLCETPDLFQADPIALADVNGLTPAVAAVPLPASAVLLAAALGGLGIMRRRRKA